MCSFNLHWIIIEIVRCQLCTDISAVTFNCISHYINLYRNRLSIFLHNCENVEQEKSDSLHVGYHSFWTNSLIRIYGWRTFLGTNGWLNNTLQALHLTGAPIEFLFNRGTTVLGMVYCLFPTWCCPLYTAIEKLDTNLLEASSDLGARGKTTFLKVILPLTWNLLRFDYGIYPLSWLLLCI